MNWLDFFAMGGYGAYVWTSYLLALVVLVANLFLPLHDRKRVLKRVRSFARADERRGGSKAMAGRRS